MSGTTFAVEFLGCKVSMVDAHEIRERLAADGHVEAEPGHARVRVVNTCCVTAEAVAKSRKAVRRAARNADRVFVTGCAANLGGDTFADTGANVTVIGRRSEETPAAISDRLGGLGCAGGIPAFARTRAYVKIQDGCSFACSYCVIPSVRGASRSRRAADVLRDAARRAGRGHRELVLTGVNLGCFRDREAGMTLAGLIRAAGEIDGLERLRLSSIEVNHLTDDLVAALRETDAASLHLHVPMQSGDDGVLRAMKRRYSAAQYVAKLAPLADFNLTADVIVGFPGEDEPAFERTLDVIHAAGITRVHAFPYSPRPGTATAAADTVTTFEKKERSARLRALSDELSRRRWASRVGSTDRVLVDRPGRGYGDDYTPWLLECEVGQLVHARAVGVSEDGILAVAA